MSRWLVLIGLVGTMGLLWMVDAGACAVCYGEPDHPMTQGAELAMITMIGVTYTVLLGLLTMFIRFFIRSKKERPV